MKGKEAFNAMNDAVAAIIDDNFICYINPEEYDNGEYSLELSLVDEEGLGWDYSFLWEEDETLNREGNNFFLEEADGGAIKFTLLETKEL